MKDTKQRFAAVERLENRQMMSGSLTVVYPAGVAKALAVAGMNHVAVKLKNVGDAALAGNANVTLFASSDAVLDENDLPIASNSKAVAIGPRRGATVKLNFASPGALSTGRYFLIAEADVASEVADVASKKPVQITQPFSDLAITIDGLPEWPVELNGYTSGESRAFARIRNAGNVNTFASGNINLYLSSDAVLDSADPLLITRPIGARLRPGQSRWFSLSLTPPAGTAIGGYFVIAELVPTSTDQVAGNNVSASSACVAIVDHLPHRDIRIINYYDDGGYDYYYAGGYYTYDPYGYDDGSGDYYYDDTSAESSSTNYDSAPPADATSDEYWSTPVTQDVPAASPGDENDFSGGVGEFDDSNYFG